MLRQIPILLLSILASLSFGQDWSRTVQGTVNHSLSGPNNLKIDDNVPDSLIGGQEAIGNIGYSFGFFANYHLTEQLALTSGIELKWKNIEYTFYNIDTGLIVEAAQLHEFMQLGIPLGVSFYFNEVGDGLCVFVMPSVDILTSSNLVEGSYKTIELTAEAGVGYAIPSTGRSIDIFLSYVTSLTDPYATSLDFPPLRLIRLKIGLTQPW